MKDMIKFIDNILPSIGIFSLCIGYYMVGKIDGRNEKSKDKHD